MGRPTPSRLPLSAMLALLALWLIWSYNWLVVKDGLGYAGPFVFGALRGVPSALVLFAGGVLARRSLRPVAPWGLAALGLFQTLGFVALTNLALVHGAVGKTTILVYTFPFWTVVLAWPLLGERIAGTQWLAVGMAGLGLMLVIEPWRLGGGFAPKLFAVASGLSWALAAVTGKWLRARHAIEVLPLTAWQMLFGGIGLIAVSLAVPEPAVQWGPGFAFALGYTILLSTATAWLLWFYVLDHLPAGIAGLNLLVIPVLTVLLSRWRYAERPGGVELGGMLLIVAGLALLSRFRLPGRAAGAEAVEATRMEHSGR